ncbi:NRDE family protein [Streptacidiphilus sp. N1-12]|uniref:NRDE family protein n=2 Tax=Streptacidiphilus alkalitolerans TaxID=3342712 RepID=A0ABV6WHD4_9ACTN
MCTAVISFDPSAPFPVLLVGVRDEFHDRKAVPPGRHWPDSPQVVGGQDLLAGGTWLAVDPGVPRAGVVLNGVGRPAPEQDRLSRGDLPLRFAADGSLGDPDAARYDPFHLVRATLDQVRLLSWDGEALTDRALEPGLHLVTNLGLAVADDPSAGPELNAINARIAHFRPRLAAARRPSPDAGPTATAWGDWLPLVDGDGLDPRDPRALVLRQDFEGRAAGTVSTTLLALGRDTVRYDFNGTPGDPAQWSTILAG